MAEPVLSVKNLHTVFPTPDGTVRAVNGLDLEVQPGEILGVVGETGSGKSVLIQSILNLVPAPGRIAQGQVQFAGNDLLKLSARDLQRIRGRDISLIVSSPRSHLNPTLRVGEQIANVIMAHRKVRISQAMDEALSLLKTVGIPDAERRLQSFPHELSGGMCQRVVIAMALANSPRLVLADEPTAGLDVTIQIQILDLFRELTRKAGSGALLVTRDLGIVAHYCDRVAVMYGGQVVEVADVRTFFKRATHPYSLALQRAAFAALGRGEQITMAGSPFNPFQLPGGCLLHPRCPLAQAGTCDGTVPELAEVGSGHLVRCHLREEVANGALALRS